MHALIKERSSLPAAVAIAVVVAGVGACIFDLLAEGSPAAAAAATPLTPKSHSTDRRERREGAK